jgi:TPR repeat protein
MTRLLSVALLSLLYITNANADIYSASNALSRGDYATAVAEFKKLAEAGNDRAQANLGYMYYAGEGLPQDYKQAVYWYRKAAVQGNKDAQYNLAVSYAFGEGVKQDLTEAAIWYRRAGEQGHVVSQYSLGISYAYGEGVPQDQKEAARWFKKASDQGYARAQVHLGSMYHTGEGVEQDYSEAVRWYRMAADRGDATAQYNLGTMYRSGKGVEQNYAQAKRWFRQSADQGYAAAQNELASLERSAAANIATRTIQAKPELFPSEDTEQSTNQQTAETTTTVQAEAPEPVQKESIVAEKAPDIISTTAAVVEVSDTDKPAKKPLFSVEKKDLLALDDTDLDIVKPEAPVEPEVEEEVVTQVEVADEEEPAEVEIADVDEPTAETSAIHNALGLPTPDDTALEDEDSEESGGFFSALGKAFTQKEEEGGTTDTDSSLAVAEPEVEEEVVTQVEVVDDDEPADIEIADVDEPTAETSAMHNALGLPTPDDTAPVDEDSEDSGGFFSALGKVFTQKEVEGETTDTDPSLAVAEPEVEEEVVTQVEVVDEEEPADVEIADIDEPTAETSAMHNALGLPSPDDTAPVDEDSEESGGFFSALGKVFTQKEEEGETTDTDPSLTVAESEVEEEVVTQVEVADDEEPADVEIADVDEPTAETSAIHNALGLPTPADTAPVDEDSEESGGFFSALGKVFTQTEVEGETTDTEPALADQEIQPESNDVLIAKLEEPAPVNEEIQLAQEAEIDLSQYSVRAGRRALTNSDYDGAVKQFKPLAEAGDSEAQAHLGSLYYVGKGVNQDINEAYNWYKKSADQGNTDAQYSIGNMYLLGEGVEQDNTNAAKWYALASEKGHIAAKNNLDNLKKLEAIKRENQLKQDALTNQDAREESVSDTIEESEEIVSSSEETTDTTSEPAVEEEKKPGLFALLGGLFGGDSGDTSTQESQIDSDVDTAVSETETEIIEPDLQDTDVKSYAAGEAPSTDTLQTLSNEEPVKDMQISDASDTDSIAEEITPSNNIALQQESQPDTSESPGFFKSLFGNDDTEINNETDNVKLEATEEIQSIDIDSSEPDEEIVIETEVEEAVDESNNAIAEVTEEEPVESEKSAGLFGFFGKMFSSDDEDEIDDSESEPSQEIAMAEPVTDSASINDDEEIIENQTGEAISNSEIERLRPLASQGDQDAQYKLGTLYYSGDGVKQDYSQSALWYRRAAQQGNVDAQYSLGNMYLMGEGIGQDDNQAAYWYTLAADQGHDSAKHNLANLQKAQASSAQLEIETSTINNDQLVNLDSENTTESVASSDTSGKTEYEQGLAYAFGDGVPQNDRTAFNLFYEAAEKGYALAQYKVGVAFAYGEGVRQDSKSAAEWYRKAAEQGYTIAQRNLATMYLDGKGIEQNKIQALAWYTVVASSGNAMDIRRRDILEKELTEIELSQSQELANQISSRLSNQSSL